MGKTWGDFYLTWGDLRGEPGEIFYPDLGKDLGKTWGDVLHYTVLQFFYFQYTETQINYFYKGGGQSCYIAASLLKLPQFYNNFFLTAQATTTEVKHERTEDH